MLSYLGDTPETKKPEAKKPKASSDKNKKTNKPIPSEQTKKATEDMGLIIREYFEKEKSTNDDYGKAFDETIENLKLNNQKFLEAKYPKAGEKADPVYKADKEMTKLLGHLISFLTALDSPLHMTRRVNMKKGQSNSEKCDKNKDVIAWARVALTTGSANPDPVGSKGGKSEGGEVIQVSITKAEKDKIEENINTLFDKNATKEKFAEAFDKFITDLKLTNDQLQGSIPDLETKNPLASHSIAALTLILDSVILPSSTHLKNVKLVKLLKDKDPKTVNDALGTMKAAILAGDSSAVKSVVPYNSSIGASAQDASQKDKGLSGGAIAGIAIGVAAAAGLGWYFLKGKKD